MNLLEAMNWRYATKRMNGQKVPQEKIDTILDTAILAPSSAGLQPFNIIVVENDELKSKIKPIANDQPQITEASHLLIFVAWDNVSEEQVMNYMNDVATIREISLASLEPFQNRLIGLAKRPAEANHQWAARQAYIAFGTAIAAAAVAGVDACPMEGFNGPALDELLGLDKKGLKSVTILALGYRDELTDPFVSAKKVRRPKDKHIIEIAG